MFFWLSLEFPSLRYGSATLKLGRQGLEHPFKLLELASTTINGKAE
jgi:hypothetical protein